jgi:Tol biopolymer transport system component
MPQDSNTTTIHRRTRRSLAALGALAAAAALGASGASAIAPAPVPPVTTVPGTPVAPGMTYVKGLAGPHPSVWIAGIGGRSPRRLGGGFDARLSPNGQSAAILASAGSGGYAIVTRPTARGQASRTLVRANETLQLIGFSPDSTRILAVVDGNRLVLGNLTAGSARVVARGWIQGASFSPQGGRIAYARSATQQLSSRVDVWTANLDGTSARAITHDGRSLAPLWGPSKIAYTHERLRRNDAPVYQLWLMSPDGRNRGQLTHTPVPTLVSGLTATQWSSDGRRLLAEFGGQDTSRAYAVDVPSGRERDISGRNGNRVGVALSADGRTVLVQDGYFDDPAHQSVATIPFGGGGSTVLVPHAGAPSWNR